MLILRQVSNKVNYLLIYLSEKCIFVSECEEDMRLGKISPIFRSVTNNQNNCL